MNEVKLFENPDLGLHVRTILNDDGSISVNAEDTAIGFGWVRDKNGKNYVMWDRFNGFCTELGFPHKCGKEDFIPESLFYMLAFKAGNERALKFQQWLAMEVLPEIRKTGGYRGQKLSEKEIMRIQLGMIDDHEERIEHLENKMTIDYGQQQELRSIAKSRAMEIIGGKDSRAYTYMYPSKGENDKPVRLYGRLNSRLWNDYKDYFHVNSYRNTPVVKYDEAAAYLKQWMAPINLQLDIRIINSDDFDGFLS